MLSANNREIQFGPYLKKKSLMLSSEYISEE